MRDTDYILNQSEIVSLAKSLRKIEQNLLKQNQAEGNSRIWFQGEEPYFDIFFEFDCEEISWFQFTFRGKSLSWERKRPELQTGTTNELSMDDASFYAASKTIENDSKIDAEFISLVKSIIQIKSDEPAFDKALQLFN
ncbi:hypothetical protein [Nostoc sp. TCL26-01]|uniref:hypothetical protein n=1 Tax=Nostoc sp. TCL26-01 TaxID=2576904 RepID=UPI0015BF07FA|nr:hypothetical protein [Nostoc sp. TCL26-01]QLE56753.1 hypothetical protein FD725_15315 [Nostoc sp. TCL26-01]